MALTAKLSPAFLFGGGVPQELVFTRASPAHVARPLFPRRAVPCRAHPALQVRGLPACPLPGLGRSLGEVRGHGGDPEAGGEAVGELAAGAGAEAGPGGQGDGAALLLLLLVQRQGEVLGGRAQAVRGVRVAQGPRRRQEHGAGGGGGGGEEGQAGQQQPGAGAAHLPDEAPELLQRAAQQEDVVPGQEQRGDLGEFPARGALAVGRRVGHDHLPQGVHGQVEVLHPLPLPAVDLPPQLLLLLRVGLALAARGRRLERLGPEGGPVVRCLGGQQGGGRLPVAGQLVQGLLAQHGGLAGDQARQKTRIIQRPGQARPGSSGDGGRGQLCNWPHGRPLTFPFAHGIQVAGKGGWVNGWVGVGKKAFEKASSNLP